MELFSGFRFLFSFGREGGHSSLDMIFFAVLSCRSFCFVRNWRQFSFTQFVFSVKVWFSFLT